MADEAFENLRLSLMQDVLPVGLAMVERARKGGPSKVVEAFTDSSDPFQDLRLEGEPAAKSLREQLDKVSPGLGNPVMEVKVAVDDMAQQIEEFEENDDQDALIHVLSRIENDLEILEDYLNGENGQSSSKEA